MSSDEEAIANGYVGAAGSSTEGRYAFGAKELTWLLGRTAVWDGLRLKLLTALQRALTRAGGDESLDPASEGDTAGDLKGLLTNLIIMQTRLNQRDGDLNDLLSKASDEGLVESVEVDPDDVRQFAESLVVAYKHVRQPGPDSDQDQAGPGA